MYFNIFNLLWIFCGLCFVVRNVGIVTNDTFSCSRARNHENVQQVYLSWCSLASFFWHMNIYWFWRKSNKNPRFPHPVVTGGQQEQRHGVKTERDKENIRNTSRSVRLINPEEIVSHKSICIFLHHKKDLVFKTTF